MNRERRKLKGRNEVHMENERLHLEIKREKKKENRKKKRSSNDDRPEKKKRRKERKNLIKTWSQRNSN